MVKYITVATRLCFHYSTYTLWYSQPINYGNAKTVTVQEKERVKTGEFGFDFMLSIGHTPLFICVLCFRL